MQSFIYGIGLLLFGLVFSKTKRIDLFRKNNPPSGLAGIFASAFMAPLLVYVYLSNPIAIVTASHFFLLPERQFLLSPVMILLSLFVLVSGAKLEKSKGMLEEEVQ